MIDTPKGETIPQTVENLQSMMRLDAEMMMQQDAIIKKLEERNASLAGRLLKCRDNIRRQSKARKELVDDLKWIRNVLYNMPSTWHKLINTRLEKVLGKTDER